MDNLLFNILQIRSVLPRIYLNLSAWPEGQWDQQEILEINIKIIEFRNLVFREEGKGKKFDLSSTNNMEE